MNLGEFIKKYREDNNLTMEDFAKRANLTKGYISMLEKNQNPKTKREIAPSFTTIQQIADAMSLSASDVIAALDDTTHTNPATIGEFIKTLRLQHNLSQEDLGKIVGVQRAAVQKWESGAVENLKRETIKKLSEHFDVPPACFILGNTATEENTASAEALQFGNRIAEAREKNGISQTDFAKILNVAQNTVSNWEKGKREPDIKMLKKIAQSLNVSLDYLLSSPTVPPPLLSAEEEKLLRLYNSADAYGKETILLFAEREATRK